MMPYTYEQLGAWYEGAGRLLGATFVEDGRDTQDEDELSGAVSDARPTVGKLVRLTTSATAVSEQAV